MELEENSTFGKRLKFYMDENNLNSTSMGEKVSKTPANIRHWCRDVRFPRSDDLVKIADILGITLLDLYPNSQSTKELITVEQIKNNLDNYTHLIPNINIPPNIKQVKVTKGYPTSSANNIVQEDSMNYSTKIHIDKRMVKTAYQEKELEAAVMTGNSMTPYLENDDIAIYHPTPTPLGDGRYVINTPHGLTIKNLKFLSNGSVLLISENSDFNIKGKYDEEYTKENVDTLEVLGLVVGRILKS